MLEVVAPGLLSTVQDAGRPDAAAIGVPVGGACDLRSLAIANVLVGNSPADPALEMTVVGPELAVLATTVIGLAGADLGAVLVGEGRALRPGAAHLVRGGSRIAFDPRAKSGAGIRAYLSLPGGIAVPRFLGSAATYVPGGFGGMEGRAVRPGDRLSPVRSGDLSAAGRRWPGEAETRGLGPGGPGRSGDSVALRIVRGPHADRIDGGVWALCAREWVVAEASDRIGLRLDGPRLRPSLGVPPGDEMVSIALPLGAIQLPPDGVAVVLLADHQTIGGYPVPAVVASVDLPVAAQLGPGDRVRCREIEIDEAQRLWRDERRSMARAIAALEAGETWAFAPLSAEG